MTGCGPMRIAILSYGTRGDVQPMVAIAYALRLLGHDVRLGTPENHLRFAQVAGVEASPITGDSEALLATPEGKAWVREGDARSLMRAFVTLFEELNERIEHDCERITDGADVIVTGSILSGVGRLFADVRKVPLVIAHTFPYLPTSAFHNGVVDLPLWGPLNKLMARAVSGVMWRALGHVDTAARARRGLAPAQGEPLLQQFRAGRPSLHLWSEALVPRPADWPHEIVTGACGLPASLRSGLGERQALADVEAFLSSGPAPFFIGLGSMPIDDPAPLLDSIASALDAVGARALIGGTFPDRTALSGRLPETIALCPAVDHDALFPRCAGVVHHGGAGTTHAGLRAGRPTMICTVLGDQPFWGRRVQQLGAGTWTRFRGLDEGRLRRGLEVLLEPRTLAAAQGIAARMRGEPDGATVAADAIVRLLR